MGVNDTGGNKTIARTMDLGVLKDRDVFAGANLVLNSIFENLTTEHANGIALHTNFSGTFQRAPGWYNFGAYSHGDIASAASATENPFRMKGSPAGVVVTQGAGKQYGLCQPIPRAAQLSGRRVRVTGAYDVVTGPGGGVQAGMSVFLVTKVSKESVDPDTTDTPSGVDHNYWSAVGPSGNWDALTLDGKSVRHVVRIACSAWDYADGEELFNRAFDWWDVGGTFPNAYSRVFLGSENASGDDAEGVGVSGDKQAVDVYYLGPVSTPADGSGTSGMLELAKDTALAAAGLTVFEAFVDIPADMLVDDEANGLYQDAWLVVMPVHPDDIASMTQDAEVRFFALSMEVVVQSAADRILYGMQAPSLGVPFGAGLGGFPIRHLLRYPVYVPAIFPLDVHALLPEGVNGGAADYADFFRYSSRGLYDYAKYMRGDGAGSNVGVAGHQVDLPPGSCVLKAAFTIREQATMTVEGAYLEQYLSYDARIPADGLSPGNYPTSYTAFERIATWDGVPYAGQTDATKSVNARRNRIGHHWALESTDGLHQFDGSGDSAGDADDIAVLGTASLWFRVTLGNAAASADYVALQSGWILAAMDPRWPHFQWKRSP